MLQPFDSLAQSYDNWYDTPKGKQIFNAEFECLQKVCPACQGRWLEVGVGTGRFASRMEIKEGVDPSSAMLELAALRGVRTYLGSAEDLPFEANSFDGILMAFTLCFIDSPEKTLTQCHRILKDNGQLLVGLIPADIPWGKSYQEKKKQGHPIYSYAHFLRIENTIAIANKSGFELHESTCTLFCEPNDLPGIHPKIESGISEQAGLTALLFFRKDDISFST